MHIFFFITKSEQGGAQTHVAQLTRWLIERGHEVAVMSAPGGWLAQEVEQLGGRFLPNEDLGNTTNPLRLWKATQGFLHATLEFKPDLVACHSTMAGLIGRFALRGRIPTIFTAHGWGFTQGAPLLRRLLLPVLERLAGRFCRRIICVSRNDLELARRHHIANDDKLVQVYNGVEISGISRKTCGELSDPPPSQGSFDSELTVEEGVRGGCLHASRASSHTDLHQTSQSSATSHSPSLERRGAEQHVSTQFTTDPISASRLSKPFLNIYFVGRLAPPKNPFLLIEALVRLAPELQERARVTIIGDGPDRERLERLIEKLELRARVELAGSLPREQVLARLREEADLFVLLSRWEGFPYSILEAMAAGVPVIASRVGGIPEVLEQDGGILVNDDLAQLTEVLTTLLKNSTTRTTLGTQARHLVESRFSVEQMCEKTFAQYKQALLQ